MSDSPVNPLIGPYQILPSRVRVDLGAIAMKGNSAFLKAPALLEPYYQIVLYHIQDTLWRGGLSLLQRSSRCILLRQPTESSCGGVGGLPLCKDAVTWFYSWIQTHLKIINVKFWVMRFYPALLLWSCIYYIYIYSMNTFFMHQWWSSVIYCLHCRFRVLVRHIGSDSYSNMDPEFPGCCLESVVIRTKAL